MSLAAGKFSPQFESVISLEQLERNAGEAWRVPTMPALPRPRSTGSLSNAGSTALVSHSSSWRSDQSLTGSVPDHRVTQAVRKWKSEQLDMLSGGNPGDAGSTASAASMGRTGESLDSFGAIYRTTRVPMERRTVTPLLKDWERRSWKETHWQPPSHPVYYHSTMFSNAPKVKAASLFESKV
eukprot:TRINITY_DN111490_c0_g1_i1.p1 TRINITY_DN111490_c0_g1~~TRINITY_DN111490_c0_g1_i1.p1  ORF type:complete len:182 (+),score=20.42 TRINITY_DN111490_c0_g1_i1:98-643(+)